ncbi:PKD domain-containing protein [Mucilaginibacter jinjuensis]|uniref:PKD domain-containing protein n=1 Tax=Mucilaginibacter jinjuensis TaxID=1176721 RepID=A0ABY7T202_9SPHI|nr:PKD domain-containing protein [Mucilaginibacter jinjuensis]WCT10273.1 PKD domain-containing protein [Mucilaginibacter jinjuensis]
MKRSLTRLFNFFAYTVLLFLATNAVAQTVSITGIDSGPYGPGSSIAVKIALNNSAACLQKTNKFNLYLSDANGNFANQTLIGTYDGFGTNGTYATFVNGIIPTNITPGTGYQVRVQTTLPASASAPSTAFQIVAGAGLQPSVSSSAINPSYPQVFGQCSASDNFPYSFKNTTATNGTVSATFHNDMDNTDVQSSAFTGINTFVSFNAHFANYTVFVRATNDDGSVVSTKAYLLINNKNNTTFGFSGSGPACLSGTGAAVTYNLDYQSPDGLQFNYPGTIYNINWGDGSNSDITICDIMAAGGHLTHNYLQSSCGQKDGNVITNKYKVTLTVQNTFCSSNSSIFGQQPILTPPTNSFNLPAAACTNTVVTVGNTSYPGQSISTTTSTCTDNAATYSWFVDGVQQASGLKSTTPFKYTFTTHGKHTVTIHLENSASGCIPMDITKEICIQDPPQPKFTLSTNTVCTPGTVSVTDNSIIDNLCNPGYTYLWTVTPSTGVSYVGTNKNSTQPVFNFTTKGKYTVQLQITSPGGGCMATAVDTVYANTLPQIALSPNFAICGNNQTLRFGPEAGNTHVTYSGTYQLQPDTYTWTVTPPPGGAPATFTAGTTANSQSPTINFPDFGTYTVSVTQKNGCGTSAPATQNITFQNAPTIDAGPDQTICANQSASLVAQITNGASVNGPPTWSGGTASGFSDPHNLSTTYTPTAAEVNAGSVTLTVTVPTNLQGSCSTVSDQVIINFHPFNTITSAPAIGTCSGNSLIYHITSTVAGSTFTWTASGSANASGYTTSGTGDINEQALYNSDAVNNATVTYIITPHSDNCDGTPFTLNVSIVPKPIISASGPGTICSGQPANINLSSNVSNTTYTWTATASDPANVTGYTSVATPSNVTQIQDILGNTGTSVASVTYIINSANGGSNDNCPGNSQTVTVYIQPAPPTASAGDDKSLCNVTSYQLQGNNLGPNGNGLWTVQSGQTDVTFDDPTVYNTTVRNLKPDQDYVFRWTSKGTAPCNDSYDEVTIRVVQSALTANFTADKTTACGTTTINFTNTSTPPSGLNYAWDFGNGVTSNLMNPQAVTFVPQTNGKDSVYTVKLTISNSCSIDTKSMNITIKPQTPIAQISPDRTLGCIPFIVNVENISPGTNDTYTYTLVDAAGNTVSQQMRTDKNPQQFTINTIGTYKVYMVATSQCGTAQSTSYTLVVTPATITPRLIINGTDGTGCGPLTVTFHNNTTGASAYSYDFGDGTAPLTTTSTGDVNHTFTKGGDYTVVLHSSNSCTPDAASAPITIHVLAAPTLIFSANNTTGCKKLDVQFTNTSTDPSTSQTADLTYDWDFGDGSPHSSAVNPAHHYGFVGSPFTVTLTATNGTGCTSTTVIKNMITVNSSSLTDFVVKPDSVVNIPVYTFSFLDQSTGGPISWHWDFGDGTTSTQKNPEHTYADTGRYKVTLTTANAYCDSTKSHYVRITGIPGQVYMPNAIMPNSVTPSLRKFYAQGSGLKTWHLQIFNNYGQLIYDTTDLNERGEPTGAWDGTFKGQPVPQGVYVWQASGTFINGNEWKGMSYNGDGSAPKRTGVIHVLR